MKRKLLLLLGLRLWRSRTDPCSQISQAALPFLYFHSGHLLCKLSSNGDVDTFGCFVPNRETGICLSKAFSALVSPCSPELGVHPSFGHTPSLQHFISMDKKV